MHAGAAVRPSAGVVTLALSPFVPAAALLGARFRAESSCLLPDPNGNLDPEAPSPANMGRRRSRAVLYQLSGHYKPEKTKTKLKLNNVSITFLPQLINSFRKTSPSNNTTCFLCSVSRNVLICFVKNVYYLNSFNAKH